MIPDQPALEKEALDALTESRRLLGAREENRIDNYKTLVLLAAGRIPQARVLAKNVAEFTVTRRDDLAHVRIRLGSRSTGKSRRGTLEFAVRMRNAGGPR